MVQALYSVLFDAFRYGLGWLVAKPADLIAARLVSPGHPALRTAVDVIFCVLLSLLFAGRVILAIAFLFGLGRHD